MQHGNHAQACAWNLAQAERHPVGSDATTEHIGKAIAHGALAILEVLAPKTVAAPELES